MVRGLVGACALLSVQESSEHKRELVIILPSQMAELLAQVQVHNPVKTVTGLLTVLVFKPGPLDRVVKVT